MLKHRGSVRGGSNHYAKFFLCLVPGDLTTEEIAPIVETLCNEFLLREGWENSGEGVYCHGGCGIMIPVHTRKTFALLPAIVRRALRGGWRVACTLWDVGVEVPDENRETGLGRVFMDEHPEIFWRELALAQAYYRE